MNANDEVSRERLFKALESSYQALDPFRKLTSGLVQEYVGSAYGGQVRFDSVLNLLHQAGDAYTMSLVANRPRCLLSTPHEQLNYSARVFQTAVNNLAQEICLEQTLKQWVLDALFCVGIIKAHMADAGTVQLELGLSMDPGMPYASNVALDNFCFDMGAARWDQVSYAGDSYRITFEDLQHSGIYDPAAVADLQPTSKYKLDQERLDQISRGQATDNDELEPMIDLCDVWVPRDGMIYTFAMAARDKFQLKGKPLAVMPWDGPEFGPYHLLGFNDVPENILPTSPFSHLSSLSRLINNIMRKQSRRAKAQKRNTLYTPAGADGAKKLKGSTDDEYIEVQDVKEISQIETGGVSQDMHSFMLGCMELFDRMSGNLTAMMGLGAQSDTLGQEQLIHGAVSKKEAAMQYRVFDGTRRLFRDLGYMLWNDKVKTIPGQIPIEGAEQYSLDATWTPDDRQGSFFDYNFDIDIYSMGYQSPQSRVSALNQLLTQIYLPALPVLMEQGGMIDFQKIAETHAELLNEPRVKQWIKFVSLQPTGDEQGPSQPDKLAKPNVTTRNVVRRNVPSGGSSQARLHVMQQAWLNRGQNQQQDAALHRPAA